MILLECVFGAGSNPYTKLSKYGRGVVRNFMVLPNMPSAAARNEMILSEYAFRAVWNSMNHGVHDIAKYASMDSQELHHIVKTTFEVVRNSMTFPKYALRQSQEPHEIFKVCAWASQELNDTAQPRTT